MDEVVATGLTSPTDIVIAPDGRIFIAEKQGTVRIWQNGSVLATPFIDLISEVGNAHDRGLLAIALDPNFAQNQYVYLLYVVDATPGQPDESGQSITYGRLTRYTANGNVANTGTRLVLLGNSAADGMPHCHDSHAIGSIKFGHDGSLFVTSGDGAHYDFTDAGQNVTSFDSGCEAMFGAAQDLGAYRSQLLNSLAGKLLRINPANGQGYTSNPFYNGSVSSIQSRIWALGLRNPIRICVKPGSPSPGTVYISDVGWNFHEELNVARVGGENFRWPCYEGPNTSSQYQNNAVIGPLCNQTPTGTPKAPAIAWHHSNSAPIGFTGNCSTGTTFYAGGNFPATYWGRVFFADYGQDWIRSAVVNDQDQIVSTSGFATGINDPVDLEVDAQGNLLYVSISSGAVRRIRYTITNSPPSAVANATPLGGDAPLFVQFSSNGTTDPDGDPLTLTWDFGDGTPTSNAANPSHTYTAPGNYVATLTVKDPPQQTATATVNISATNEPPTVQLTSPAVGYRYEQGGVIQFAATGNDPEEGPNVAYHWEVQVIHNNHIHPEVMVSDAAVPPPFDFGHGAPEDRVSYKVIVRVTDSFGLQAAAERTILPATLPPNSPPIASFLATPSQGSAPLLVNFDATGSVDPDADLLTYDWDFGDGTLGAGATTSHIYSNSGNFNAVLTVADPIGTSNTFSAVISTLPVVATPVISPSGGAFANPVSVTLTTATAGAEIRYTTNGAEPNGTSSLYSGAFTVSSSATVKARGLKAGMAQSAVASASFTIAPPSDPALIGHWKLDEGSSVAAADSSTNGNNGILQGAAAWVPGRFGSAVQFDGIDDYIDCGTNSGLAITGQLTLAAWIKLADPEMNAYMRIISKKGNWNAPDGYYMEVNPKLNYLHVLGAGGDFAGADGFDLDTNWHHVAAVINGGVCRTYIDGVDRTTNSSLGRVAVSAQPFQIGRQSNGGGLFKGAIDDVRVYNRALTAAEISSLAISLPPTITITSPADGVTINSTSASIQFASSGDLSAANHVHLKLDNNPEVMEFALTGVHSFNNLSAGAHSVVATLVNSSHTALTNPEATAKVDFTIQPPPPTITITAPADGASFTSDSVEVFYTTEGTMPAGAHIHLQMDAGLEFMEFDFNGSHLFTGVPLGAHTIRAFIVDGDHLPLANPESTDLINVTRVPPNQPPTAQNVSATTTKNVAVAVQLSASDPENSPLQYTVLTQPANGALSGTAPNLTYTPNAGFVGQNTFTYQASDGAAPSNVATATITVEDNVAPPGSPKFASGFVAGVNSSAWTTVNLPQTFNSMIVVCSPNYTVASAPAVVRVRNAAGGSFEMMAQPVQPGASIAGISVHYLAVEEGVYTLAGNGVKMEAVKYNSTVTDGINSWNGEVRTMANSYTTPAVVGQVMSYNDPAFSVFWSRGNVVTNPPLAGNLRAGKHTGEDPVRTRAAETVGYLVFEAGPGQQLGSKRFTAGVSPDFVNGIEGASVSAFGFSGLTSASAAIVSSAGMDGGEGGWPVLNGASAVAFNLVRLSIDEDNIFDAERAHTSEQVGYIVLE